MNLKLPLLTLAATALLLVACGPGGRKVRDDSPCCIDTSVERTRVQTTSGPIAGYVEDGVWIYKGIPYAKAERFMAPVDPEPWTDVRPCRAYGPVSPQGPRAGWYDDAQAFSMHWDDGFQDEDCLRLNVWTAGINDGHKRPVMVWLHGGGFHAGSSQELISYDGRALARNHDVVLVSLNHRLNVLGYLDLSAFGAKYAASGNAGMLDMVKALEWVRDNIASFGGDPANVTIFGQSGGGGKVTTLMSMPSAAGLFHKAIVESGSIMQLMPASYARRVGAYTVEELGINPSKVDQMAEVPYTQLYEACQKAVERVRNEAMAEGGTPKDLLNSLLFGTEPVVDGDILPAQPSDPVALALAKDVPVIIGTTFNEFTPAMEDPIFRPLAIEQANLKAAFGNTVYMYRFDWKTPILDGAMGSPHCMELPFVFDNVALHYTYTGGCAEDIALGHRISRLWTSFARTGKPEAEGMPVWEPYTVEGGATMILDNISEIQYFNN